MKAVYIAGLSCLFSLGLTAQEFKYPQSRTVVASDDYFGTVISDPYRWLEDMTSTEVTGWFKAQDDFTKSYLKNIPGRATLLQDIKELSDMHGDEIRRPYKTGTYYYYLKRQKGENFSKLYRKAVATGNEELFFDNQHYKKGSQILSYTVNRQQNLMALQIQNEGSELCEIVFIRPDDKVMLNEKLYPVWSEFPVSFTQDGKGLIYSKATVNDTKDTEALKNMSARLHLLGSDPKQDKILASAKTNPELNILPERFPTVSFSSDGKYLFLEIGSSRNYSTVFYTEAKNLSLKKISWRPLIGDNDKVTNYAVVGNNLFYLTFKDAPRFKIEVTDIQKPDLKNGKRVVPESQDIITGLLGTRNQVIFSSSNGIVQRLFKIDPQTYKIAEIPTPGGMNYGVPFNEKESDDLVIVNSNWLSPTYLMEYHPGQYPVKSTWLNTTTNFPDFTQLYEIKEVEVPGHDGVRIPLSIIYPKNTKLDGNNPLYMIGYGGYGISFNPSFLREELAFLKHGGIIAIAHVRGGGEKGEAWHQAGLKITKPNTWKDFISCAEYLIQTGYTSPQKLIGEGTSMGGVLIGRAITVRPDLFAAAIANVGMTQVLRNETTANGDNQIPEIGSVKNRADIAALIEMDVQSKIRKGEKYPAVLVTTGINDVRVAPWMPAKLAAAMQASSGSGKPVFLSVDYKGAHWANDIGTGQDLLADTLAFALWQAGHPDFQRNQ